MARSKSSATWLKEHFEDPFVKQAQADGYRSRASYKLLALQEKDRLIRPGMTIVDLGSAPGGWSQVATALAGTKGRVIACDLLPMSPIAGVNFIQGDFTEKTIYEKLLAATQGSPVDLVISDMAPNMSGMNAVDQPCAMYLAELAFDLACHTLRPDGAFATKVFQGTGFDAYLVTMRRAFGQVISRKPPSSRSRSRELYLIGKGFRG